MAKTSKSERGEFSFTLAWQSKSDPNGATHRALDYLFDTLKKHGQTFPPDFWDTVCKEVLFPIFAVLRSRSDVSRFSTHEDMSVWLSTTMIQALRNLVDLFTFYFDVLARMLDKLLDLLCECICQGALPVLSPSPTLRRKLMINLFGECRK